MNKTAAHNTANYATGSLIWPAYAERRLRRTSSVEAMVELVVIAQSRSSLPAGPPSEPRFLADSKSGAGRRDCLPASGNSMRQAGVVRRDLMRKQSFPNQSFKQ